MNSKSKWHVVASNKHSNIWIWKGFMEEGKKGSSWVAYIESDPVEVEVNATIDTDTDGWVPWT